MTDKIHPSAVIDSSAQLADDVEIGPFVTIGKDVKLASGVKVSPNAYLEYCEIGEGSVISPSATIGTPPQDLGYKGEKTGVIVGKNCQIRENTTINRASGEGNLTIVGDNCLLMTGAHIAHNCKLGNNVIFANLATIGGHVIIENNVFLGGMTVVHQNVRIGEMTILGGLSGTRQDLPPYAKASDIPANIYGINSVGLKRQGISLEERSNLKKAFNIIWQSDLNMHQAIDKVKEEIETNKYIEHLLDFILQSKRGVTRRSGKKEA